jgi:hypothetical protein
MLAAAIPMHVFYQVAVQRTLTALDRFSAEEFQRAVEVRNATFDAWKHKVGRGGDDSWKGFSDWMTIPLASERADSTSSYCSEFDVVCAILQHLPDYNKDVSGVHTMYRTPQPEDDTFRQVQATFLVDAPPEQSAFLLVATGLFLVVTAVAIWYLLVRMFGLRADDSGNVSSFVLPAMTDTSHRIIYGAPRPERQSKYFAGLPAQAKLWIDLRDQPVDAKVEIPALTDAIALDEFDSSLNDIVVLRQRTELLERLLREQRRVVLLFVSTDPLNFATSTYDPEKEVELLTRFATALARFKYTYHSAETPAPNGDKSDWRTALVAAECRHPDLWEIRDELIREAKEHHWTKGQIVQQVQSRAHAIYQRMWSQCTRAEKFTLIELARGNPINPNNWDAARRLTVRGHIRIDPFYRIASDSLREFVSRMAQIERTHSWDAANPGTWTQIKIPLIVLFLGALVFLGATQPNLFNTVLAFVAAGAAGFPFLFNAINARLQRAADGSR